MKQVSLFEYTNYIAFLKSYLKSQPRAGRGLLRQWSQELGIHTTLMSQIMSESRELTEEQALELTSLLRLPKLESEYFMLLVKYKRAATKKLRDYYHDRIKAMQTESHKISERVPSDKTLSESEKAIFYSNWMYSAIRIACSLGDGLTTEEIQQRFQLPTEEVTRIIDFLREAHLILSQGQRFQVGPRFTHLGQDSIFLPRHHNNWRLQALERSALLTTEELMYTAPFSISKKHFHQLREKCVLHIQDFLEIAKNTEAEEVACFNMDLFYVKPLTKK